MIPPQQFLYDEVGEWVDPYRAIEKSIPLTVRRMIWQSVNETIRPSIPLGPLIDRISNTPWY